MKLLNILTFITLILGLVYAAKLEVFEDKSARDRGIFLWSAIASFKSSPTDGQLVEMVKDAFDSMQAKAKNANRRVGNIPWTMSALAVGNDVYFTSGSKGKSLIYTMRREQEDSCGEMWPEVPEELKDVLVKCAKSVGDQHIFNAQCAEIDDLFVFYVRTEKSASLKDGEARVVTWEKKKALGQIKDPCGSIDNLSFGCSDVISQYDGKVKALKQGDNIRSQGYASIGPEKVQVQLIFPENS